MLRAVRLLRFPTGGLSCVQVILVKECANPVKSKQQGTKKQILAPR